MQKQNCNKYFIGCLYDDYKINPLKIKDDDLLNKCNTIWGQICADVKTELNDEPVYN